MKKLLSLVLALALVFTFAVSAFAATAFPQVAKNTTGLTAEKMDEITGKTQEDVHINVVADETAIYRVDLVWESMDFNYTLGLWDTDAHRYVEGTWDDPTRTIKITNHSNRDVDYTVTCTPNDSWGDVTFATDITAATLKYVVEGVSGQQPATIDNDVVTLTIEGDPATTVIDQVVGDIVIAFTGTDKQAGTAWEADAAPQDWDNVHLTGNETRTAVAGDAPVVTP